MKNITLLIVCLTISVMAFAQKPSKEQMEADKKRLAEATKKLNEQTAKMSPAAKKGYDSLLAVFGVSEKMNNAVQQVNSNNQTAKTAVGLVPAKDAKAIASIAATPSNAGMGAFISTAGNASFAAVLPAAKSKADDIYKALKANKASTGEIGNAAAALWMIGKTEIALGLMAQVCKDDANNMDNLNNYAAMLTMAGAPELAIPILNNLNARFKNNSTLLNNLGQAWFALGDMDKATKYLDSTLLMAANHPQANETRCLIDESQGNKTAAVAHAKAAFKQGVTASRSGKLKQLGYTPGAGDYNNFPPANKSDDLLNLGDFAMPAFPKSVAECRGLEPVWKQFRADVDGRIKVLQKSIDEANKETLKRLQGQQQQFMDAKNKVLANPLSMSQGSAMQIVGAPMFSEKMNARENIVLQNLQKKKQAAAQRIAEFANGEGATLKKEYADAKTAVDKKMKEAEDNSPSKTVDPGAFCPDYVEAADKYLKAYNTKLEGLYNEYLNADKQLMNEMSYSSLYTTYPEILPGINAGLQAQWLRDLSLTQNGFNFESITKYTCDNPADGKGGRLTMFKNPACNINSEFGQTLGLANLGFSIKLDCNGMTTTVNALAIGITLNQDLDHAGFGDSYKNCTVSIGPKIGANVKAGPVEIGASGGVGADIEIDRTGITDVVLTAGAEAGVGAGPVGVSGGAEGRISLNSGAGSINGTGAFKR